MSYLFRSLFKSFYNPVKIDKKRLSWLSCLLFFKQDNIYYLDKAYIFVGKIDTNIVKEYLTFINFYITEGDLIYLPFFEQRLKNTKVHPEDVYLHIHVGDTIFDIDYFYDNPDYYLHHFSSSNNRLYRRLKKEISGCDIKIIDMTGDGKLNKKDNYDRLKIYKDRRFMNYQTQIYGQGLDNLLLRGIDVDIF